MIDEDELIHWCQPCRETGLLHCAHPEDCGQMDEDKRIPRREARQRWEALRD